MKNQRAIAVIVFILSIALSIVFFIYADFLKEAKTLGLFGLFVINFVSNASFFISAPSMISVFAAGDLYSPILIALVSSFGSACGDLLSFIIGHSGRKVFNHRLSKYAFFQKFEGVFKKYGTWLVFIFSFLPNPFFDSMGLIAGITRFPPLRFFFIVFVGRLLRFFMVAKLGSIY